MVSYLQQHLSWRYSLSNKLQIVYHFQYAFTSIIRNCAEEPKIFCNFCQKALAKNSLSGTSEADAESQTEEEVPTEDGVKHEKNWTKNLKTDDQTVLRTAKEAQEMENKALSRFEEVQLTGTTTVGVSQTDTGTECASVEEDENKEKVWTITAFTENGIVSNKCQNGKIIDSWELKYTNPNDAKKVQDFLGRFEKDANLIFSGSKDFWEDFLSSDMDDIAS